MGLQGLGVPGVSKGVIGLGLRVWCRFVSGNIRAPPIQAPGCYTTDKVADQDYVEQFHSEIIGLLQCDANHQLGTTLSLRRYRLPHMNPCLKAYLQANVQSQSPIAAVPTSKVHGMKAEHLYNRPSEIQPCKDPSVPEGTP